MPVTVEQVRVSVPPGVAPGVLVLVTAPPQPVITALPATYCSVPGSTSVMSTLVSVWPLATLSVSVNVRGKLGPVAVSLSGAAMVLASVISDGVTPRLTVAPLIAGSVAGLLSGSAPRLKIGVTAMFLVTPSGATEGSPRLNPMLTQAGGSAGGNDPSVVRTIASDCW